MNRLLRKYLLLPLSMLYALITEIRNGLYDVGILKSNSYNIPIICVGNLNVGGSGKTPQIEYLIRLLKDEYKIAVLSRGYKRKTKGFILANENSTPQEIGDEPYQIIQKFPNITLAVSEKRAPGIEKLLQNHPLDVILLDDAYQHRQVKAGLNILLTPSGDIFPDDFILPSGNLRECKHQAKRADVVIVTKTNAETNREKISKKIKRYFKKDLFFSKIEYASTLKGNAKDLSIQDLNEYKILLVTGIANPQSIYDFLSKKNINFDKLKFSDHYSYTEGDAKQISNWFKSQEKEKKVILTTEKDFVKLKKWIDFPLYYLPIQTVLEKEEEFNKKIIDYVDSRKFI